MLLIVGASATGKTTAGRSLARLGWRHVEASDVFRRIALRPPTRRPEDPQAADSLFKRDGFDVVARTLLAEIGTEPSERIALSGLRTPEEIVALLNAPHSIRVVVLQASFQTRLARTDEGSSHLRRRDLAEFGWGLLPVAADVADRVVVNEDSLANFVSEIELLGDDAKWRPAVEPSEEAKLRYSALATLGSEQTHPLPSILAEDRQLTQQSNGHRALRPAGRAYMELMRVRWRTKLPGAGLSGT